MYDVRGPLGFGVRRATYLIDQARYIRGAVLADFRIGEHEEFIRRAAALSAGRGAARAAAEGAPPSEPDAHQVRAAETRHTHEYMK